MYEKKSDEIVKEKKYVHLSSPQSAEAGDRDEHEPQLEAGRAAARRPSARNDGRALRDTYPAAGTHQERRVLPERGQRGQARHGCHQGEYHHQRRTL